jgi:glyoxylate utilization-related uncharacterized protein
MTIEGAIKFLEENDYVVVPRARVQTISYEQMLDQRYQYMRADYKDLERHVKEHSATALADQLIRDNAVTWRQWENPRQQVTVFEGTLKVIRP